MSLQQEQRTAAEQAHAAASLYSEQHGNPRSASENDALDKLWATARRLADIADGICDPTTLGDDSGREATVPLRAPAGEAKYRVNEFNGPDTSDDGIAAVTHEPPTEEEWRALDPETRIRMNEAGIGLPPSRTRRQRRHDAKARLREQEGTDV